MAGSLLLASDSTGSSKNITSTLQLASYTSSGAQVVIPSVRLSSLNGAAATITLTWRHYASNGTTLIREQAYAFAKPQTSSTVAGDDMPAVLLANGEILTVAAKSSNGSDTAAAYTISWLNAVAANLEQVNGTNIPAPNTAGYPLVDTAKVSGTTQTARDLGESVLVGDKTGFSLTSGERLAIHAAFPAQITATVNDAAATTTSFIGSSGLSSTDDFYNGLVLAFTSGALAGLARRITDYTGLTKTFTFAVATPSAPANAVSFIILGKIDT